MMVYEEILKKYPQACLKAFANKKANIYNVDIHVHRYAVNIYRWIHKHHSMKL